MLGNIRVSFNSEINKFKTGDLNDNSYSCGK